MRCRNIVLKITVLILILFICLYSFHLVQKATSLENSVLLYSFGDLDQHLCKKTIDWPKKSIRKVSNKCRCPQDEIVTVASMGRTGNLMWAYASVLSVAKQTGLKPYVPSCIKDDLETYFDTLTVPDFSNIIDCPVRFQSFVTSVREWQVNPKSIILPRYLITPQEILPWIPNIRQEFTFKKELKKAAQQILKNFIETLPVENYTFIGVHVRRTDYRAYLKVNYNMDLAPTQFFFNAIEFYRRKYYNTLYIFVSDDPHWCSQKFGYLRDVFIVTSQNLDQDPTLDLAVLAACNHTIYDYGTFAEWGAILAGGEAVCYDMIQNSKSGSLQYNNSWHLMY